MNQAPRLVSTRDLVDLSNGYPGLRVAVTCEDDLAWLHETLAVGDRARQVCGVDS